MLGRGKIPRVKVFMFHLLAIPKYTFGKLKYNTVKKPATDNQDEMPFLGSSSDSDEGFERSFSCGNGSKRSKTFNDNVHDHIELPSLCYKIINTPQFQRLRNLKQLGLCYHVYPTASHNRFEHCIGTSHLAGKYAKSLRRNQPELGINDKDILCLYVAGLCHDIGHGPFSHTWEHFMKQFKKDYSHEDMSIRILDYMIEDNGLWEYFESCGLGTRDLEFIKECIRGHPSPGKSFVGRGREKYFLYQIISNDETKVDVDKFDYILRDCKQLNVRTAFDYDRVIENSIVLAVPTTMSPASENESEMDGTTKQGKEEEETKKIVYRKKITENLEDLFKGRFRLHQIAYQHRVTKIIEEMVLDGLIAAEPYFEVKGKNGNSYKLSSAHTDLSAFMKLTDCIFDLILSWSEGGTAAKDIFNCILKRDLYKYLGYVQHRPVGSALDDLKEISPYLKLISTSINYGNGNLNPLSKARFYEKTKPTESFYLKFSSPKMEEKHFIVLQHPLPRNSSYLSLVDLGISEQKLQKWSATYNIEVRME